MNQRQTLDIYAAKLIQEEKRTAKNILDQARDIWGDDTSFDQMLFDMVRGYASMTNITPHWEDLNDYQQKAIAYDCLMQAKDRHDDKRMPSMPSRAIGLST